MAQVSKSRTARAVPCAILVAALIAGGGEASPAWSLTMPLETPTVPVQAPPPPVKTPTVPVPVKTPTVPVKTPTVPAKTPTVPVRTPTPPVKTTAKTPPPPVKAPSVSIKTPQVSAKAPSVDVSTPAGSVRTTTGHAKVPSVIAETGKGGSASTTSGAPRAASTGSAPPASGSSPTPSGTAPGGSSPLGTYGTPGAGYGELPAPEGSLGHRARARIARRERQLKATVEHFRGCLAALPAGNRELLELRTGYGAAHPLSPRATADFLHVDAARIARQERQAVRELTAAAGTHSCGRTSELVNAAMSYVGTGLGGGHGTARGGIEAVRYESAPPKHRASSSSTLGRVLGADIPPVASDVILVLLLLMALGLVMVLLIADAAGQGPRHEQWRQRVINRVRALLH